MISNSKTLTNNFPDILVVYCIFIISYFLLKRNRNYTENYVTPSGVFDSRGKTLSDKISCDMAPRHLGWFSMILCPVPMIQKVPDVSPLVGVGLPQSKVNIGTIHSSQKSSFISTIHAPIAHDNDNIHTNIVVIS